MPDAPTPLEQALERLAAKDALIAELRSDLADRDQRIATVEAAVEATHKVFDGVGVTWSVGNEATRLPLAKRAALAVEPGFLANAERQALEKRIADLERDLAAKDKSLKTAHAALGRICEGIGAPAPACPDDVIDAVKTLHAAADFAEGRAKEAEQALKEIGSALCGSGCATFYDAAKSGGEPTPIPDPERIRLLGERVRGEHAERIREGDRADFYRQRLADAGRALDDRGAPCFADGIALTLAARIRAIPR